MPEPTPTPVPASPPTPAPSPAAHPSRRRRILAVFFSLLLLLAVACAAWWYFVLRHEESTDDAYVAGNVVRIMPQVSGRVLTVLADDTDRVRAGQTLLRLDTDDARLALENAKVELAAVVRDICRLQAQWRESVAQVEAARVTREQSASNLQRREVLGRENAVRVEELHNYRAQVKTDIAQWEAAQERQKALEAQLLPGPSLQSGQSGQSLQPGQPAPINPRDQAAVVREHPRVRQAAVTVRQRWLDLARCEVVSPVAGQVAQRSAQPGVMVTAGSMLMAVIPLDSMWVDANFKEVQLRHMRQGQPATVRVDLHGNAVTYTGRVIGFSAGTGSAFSLIPPQNATGNWIKIVQRVPVRIELDPGQTREHPLLIGLSSLVSVDISQRTGPLLTDTVRQRPLPVTLQVQGGTPDMATVDADIARIVSDNMLTVD